MERGTAFAPNGPVNLWILLVLQQDETERLIDQLGHERYEAREEAQRRLIELGPAVETRLKNRIEMSSDAELRDRGRFILQVVRYAPIFGRPLAIEFVLADGYLRKVEILGRLQDTALLIPLLTDEDPAFRDSVAQSLYHKGGRRHSLSIARLLENREVRMEILNLLAAMSALECAPQIAALLEDSDPGLRSRCCEVLGILGARSCAQRIAGMTCDPSAEVRVKSCVALGRLRARDHAAEVAALLRDPVPEVRRAALTEIPDLDEKRSHLHDAAGRLDDPVARVRISALSALAAYRARELAASIAGRLKDTDVAVRATAARVLAGMGALEHSADLARLLGDPEGVGRFYAVLSLRELDAVEHVESVRALQSDPDPEVRDVAARTVQGWFEDPARRFQRPGTRLQGARREE
jgi:HEAT repeat protein